VLSEQLCKLASIKVLEIELECVASRRYKRHKGYRELLALTRQTLDSGVDLYERHERCRQLFVRLNADAADDCDDFTSVMETLLPEGHSLDATLDRAAANLHDLVSAVEAAVAAAHLLRRTITVLSQLLALDEPVSALSHKIVDDSMPLHDPLTSSPVAAHAPPTWLRPHAHPFTGGPIAA
jgi:hypothetical protein